MHAVFSGLNTWIEQLATSYARKQEEISIDIHWAARFNGKSSVHLAASSLSIPKIAKLDFSRFNGSDDPTSWICRVEQFSEFQQTPSHERVLKVGIHARYDPIQYKDFFGDLTKLKQETSVQEYQSQFERLLNRSCKTSSLQQVGCFVSGLKENICVEVQATRPTTLSAVVGPA
ncbi:hypothetical protein CFOL_v3_12101 [Cephalotus follicularis]|uniref:Retrotransposon gag domain-containing protein n=1 Tax=Cephalotus follicularis TaxID=3775 RepID=A0A1Q3BL04_CEPFO|nr:hypothetical protein CFOL_v3_12101 [Cephalotus follicularis]